MRCSECGVQLAFRIEVQSVNTIRWYVTLLIGLCAISALSFASFGVSVLSRKSNLWVQGLNMLVFLTCGIGLVLWLRHRGRITASDDQASIQRWFRRFFLLMGIVFVMVFVQQWWYMP